ncbi:hypothetical protein ACLMJK_001934 [Lecanora helva]
MTSLYSEAFQDFLRARLDMTCSRPYKWHPSQPTTGWQEYQTEKPDPYQPHCRLLQLPRELRDEIYKLVLGEGTMVHVSSDSRPYYPSGTSPTPDEDYETNQDLLVYTDDLYFDRCVESDSERRVYNKSLQNDFDDDWGVKTRQCQFQCGSCLRHDHCNEIRSGKVFETALFRSCRQIHQEASAILMETYIFSFSLQHTLTTFTDQLTPARKNTLKNLHLSLDIKPNGEGWLWDQYDLMNSLASLNHLSTLHLSLNLVCGGDFQEQIQQLQEESLPIWKNLLAHFRRPSLKDVTVTLEDLRFIKDYHTRSPLSFPSSDFPWTRTQKAIFAEEIRRKILSREQRLDTAYKINTYHACPMGSSGGDVWKIGESKNLSQKPLHHQVGRQDLSFATVTPLVTQCAVLC